MRGIFLGVLIIRILLFSGTILGSPIVPYFGVLISQDPTISGTILGSPIFGNSHLGITAEGSCEAYLPSEQRFSMIECCQSEFRRGSRCW